ncbi:NUDIX hydrolase [Streptomyces sp. NPDC049954]|uniref:NUDIX hydrolase n=1 Tax=Streptomyces sp. NPDC049954 TaxID=3155779 RepID=UPI0034231D97
MGGVTGPDGQGTPGPVRAAGCVLWRRAGGAGREFCLVHRPKYDDWSHPKGKLKPGEDYLGAALREVAEETGRACRPGRPLPTVHYVARGRPKTVAYWVAEAVSGSFEPNDEVDEIRWLPAGRAGALLTQPRDRMLLDAAVRELSAAAARPPGR